MDKREKLAAVRRKKLFSLWDLLVAAAVLAVGLGVFFLAPRVRGSYALVYSDGAEVLELDLSRDAEYTVRYGEGYNTLRVIGGGVEVSGSSCPDKVCVHFGRIDKTGQEIVCLPNRLVIKIYAGAGLDGVTG